MSFKAELKKFELSSVFTINFSWMKRYVELDNGMYTPMKNISDDEFREIESSFYALQVTWKAWREAKAQAVLAQLDVNSILHDIDCYFDNGLSNTERTANNLLQSIYEKLSGEVKAQEQNND